MWLYEVAVLWSKKNINKYRLFTVVTVWPRCIGFFLRSEWKVNENWYVHFIHFQGYRIPNRHLYRFISNQSNKFSVCVCVSCSVAGFEANLRLRKSFIPFVFIYGKKLSSNDRVHVIPDSLLVLYNILFLFFW